MKLALALVLSSSLPALGADKIPWSTDQTAGLAQAGERRAPLMILFTGPECGDKGLLSDETSGKGTLAKKQDFQNRCELIEADVLSQADVVAAAARFVPVQSAEGLLQRAKIDAEEQGLNRRYHVATIPTVLFADPWGNEIIRLVGRFPKDAFLRVLKAIPSDFTAIEATARQLQKSSDDAQALVADAAFYQERGLLAVSERLYETALATPLLKTDVAERRKVVIARGVNLMRMDKASDAAKLFEKTLAEAPDGPSGDALYFGWMMAELHAGRSKEARAAYAELAKRFPGSPYTAKAKQNLDAAGH